MRKFLMAAVAVAGLWCAPLHAQTYSTTSFQGTIALTAGVSTVLNRTNATMAPGTQLPDVITQLAVVNVGANPAYVCWLGGTASASSGCELLAVGASDATNLASPNAPTFFSTNGTTLAFRSGPNAVLPANIGNPYPSGSTPTAIAASGTTGAVTATLAAATGQKTYICGFDINAIGGTAAIGPITITGLVNSTTFTYQASSTAAGVTLARTFTPCIPSNAVNTGIVITTTADGSASAVNVSAWGFQL